MATWDAVKRNERSERQRKATCRNANHRTPSCLPERRVAPLQCWTLMSNRDVAASSDCNSCLVLLSAFAPIPVLVSAITVRLYADSWTLRCLSTVAFSPDSISPYIFAFAWPPSSFSFLVLTCPIPMAIYGDQLSWLSWLLNNRYDRATVLKS